MTAGHPRPTRLAGPIGGTLLWDALLAWITPRHVFLGGWWLVYSSSLVFFGLLLAVHGILVAWIAALRARAAS